VSSSEKRSAKGEVRREGEEDLHAGKDHPHLLQQLLVALAKLLLL